MDNISAAVRAEPASVMVPNEEISWADRPVAKHAWTAIGTSSVESRTGRAIIAGIIVLLSGVIAAIGCLLLLGAFAVLFDSPSKVGGFRWHDPSRAIRCRGPSSPSRRHGLALAHDPICAKQDLRTVVPQYVQRLGDGKKNQNR